MTTIAAATDLRVDLHVLHSPFANREWRRECLASIDGHPVNIHHAPAITGNPGSSRANGYRLGKADFCAYVDEDDYLLPGAVDACVQALYDNPQAVAAYTDELCMEPYINEFCLTPGKSTGRDWTWARMATSMSFVHPLVVYRRAVIAPLLDHLSGIRLQDYRLAMLASGRDHRPFVHVKIDGYVWRIHEDGDHRRNSREDRRAAIIETQEYLNRKD